MLRQGDLRRERDAQRYRNLDHDMCMLCDARGPDKRSLYVSCFYDVAEVVDEFIDLGGLLKSPVEGERKFAERGYMLRICKTCRGAFLGHLQDWASEMRARRAVEKNEDGGDVECAGSIPMRENGAIRMLTRAEWDAERAP